MRKENGEGKSLAETPTYAVATVITVLVSLSFLFQSSLRKLMKVRGFSPSNLSHFICFLCIE